MPSPKHTTQPPEPGSRALATLRELIDSGRPLIYVCSAEEERVGRLLHDAARTFFPAPVPLWAWSLTEGLRRTGDAESDGGPPLTARGVLDFIAGYDGPAIFHLKDFHEPLRDAPDIRRRLRDLYTCCFDRGKFLVITSPVRFIPEELTRSIVYVELGVPDLTELAGFLQREGAALSAAGATVDRSETTVSQLARALQGLTIDESRHAVRRALAATKTLGAGSIPALLEEKRLLVNRTGLIEYIADPVGIEQIGGLEILKRWLTERRKLFELRDRISAEIVPKGVLVMGISGCGKSLAIKAVASCFGLPLYRIDMIEVFSGRHGKPEGAFSRACHMLEDIVPAVVWFDEIEAGIHTDIKEGGGELSRIFGFFLTWMQEKARGLFVGATANRIDLLPAEMIRKGRFDEVFFVDLPLDDERVDIFKVHLRQRGVDPEQFNLERMKRFTKGWSGAEIEQCVVSAFTAARLEDRELADDDLLNAASSIVPLSKTMKEQVDHIRAWAFDRAVRASPREFSH